MKAFESSRLFLVVLALAACHRAPNAVVRQETGGTTQDRATASWDRTIDAPAPYRKVRCEIHGRPLERGVVPINERIAFPDAAYVEARERMFPNANEVLHDGSIYFAAKARITFCSACRSERRKWLNAHPGVDETGERPRRQPITVSRDAG
jgi:hypothetical protein